MRQNLLVGFIIFASFYFLVGFSSFQIQENRPPEIKIAAPLAHSGFSWNSILPYEIQVSDEEDGNSEYDEISPNEVLLVVRYLNDSSELKSYLTSESKIDYRPLVQMGNSTCFTCHKAKGNLIGPSFERIAAKYNNDPKAVATLTNKIITGGSSVWGDEKMPPHPDLGFEQVQDMVRWILENNSDSNKNYLAGTVGAIKTKEQPISPSKKSVLVLTASYMDHGSIDQGLNSKQGQTTLVLKSY